MEKRKVDLIDEKLPLIPLSRRQPFFYIERAKIFKLDQDIRVSYKKKITKKEMIESSLQIENSNQDIENEEEYKSKQGIEKESYKNTKSTYTYIEHSLPVASIGGLLIGPGCSMTSESIRVCSARGCALFFTGGQGFPVYAHSTQHRSPLNRLQQMEVVLNSEKRKKAADLFFEARATFIKTYDKLGLPPFPVGNLYSSIEQMMAAEGAWAKAAYSYLAKKFNVSWHGKDQANFLHFLNHISYSLADIAILHLGYDPNIGVLHGRTRGGGLCYDLADIYKPLIALELSFEFKDPDESFVKIKENFFKRVVDFDVIKNMISVLERAFQ